MKCTKMRGKMKKFLLCFLLLAVAAGTGFSVYVWTEEKQAEERIEGFKKMRQMASLNQSEEEIEVVPVDFEELKKINPDIYAWLTIPGTAIDMPILQKEGDVSYYLLIPGMEKKIRTVQYAVKVSITDRALKTFIPFYTEIIVKTVLCLEVWRHLQMKNFLKSISL